MLRKITEEKVKDPNNKDLEIWKDPQIMEACKKAKVKTCLGCGGIYCLIKQELSKKKN